jgi:two-component system phosphate regulon sensor histidine kinase PhoR
VAPDISSKPVRARLFSKLTLTYFILLLLLFLAVDVLVEHILQRSSLSETRDALVADFRIGLFIIFVTTVILGAGVYLAFSARVGRRIRKLQDFSTRMGKSEFRPISLDGPSDELAQLAEAMNGSAALLEHTVRLLGSERDRSGAILRSMVEGVGVIDSQERLVFWNAAFSEILNIDSVAAEGRPVIEVIRNTKVLKLIRRALKGEESLQDDITTGIVQLRMFAVTAAAVRATGSPIGSAAAGKPSGAVVVLHDVTELRRLERVRQDFVANVSHEFKTPLTAIQGFAETLLGGALEDDTNNRRFLEIIRDHAAQLARVTDDLLKLARIEAGKLEVQLGPVNVAEVVEICAETTMLRAGRKGIDFEANIPSDLPPVRADARLLREVLQNLLDNATQYTPAGGRVEVQADAGPRDVKITVADTGIGIPLADQERIFERFYRVDAARSREEGGTGLGLSIARHIVETLGGRLWVESEVGQGSRFSFTVPKAA